MRHFLCIFIGCFCLALPLCAQSNKMIKELESKRGALQKQIAESETLLNTTKKDVGSQLNGLAALTGQIEERKRYILAINNDMETIDRELSKLERQLVRLENDLKDKKKKYESSVQYKKRKEANQLNARIDRLIAEEIEKARKRAAEEARKEAAARKKAAAKETKSAVNSSSEKATTKKAAPLETYTMDKADRELSGSFVSNRGKLPMPITGPYIITSRYGQYSVEGLRNVKLDNKGIDIQGKPGAQARAIFNGKVAAVFQLNGLFNILIRHGNYISVYCNLSSASVKTGDTVTIRQVLGQVFSDGADNGRTVLHFQLRKEKEKLNPEPWLNR